MPTLYALRTHTLGYQMAKFDADFNVAAVYSLTATETKPTEIVCDCPGWLRRAMCKHVRMLHIFQKAEAINTDRFYCYETQTWHQPIQTYGEGEASAAKAAALPTNAGEGPGAVHARGSPLIASPSQELPLDRITGSGGRGQPAPSPTPPSGLRRLK